MPLPAPLETATINGTWESPVGGGPLVGTATLIPLADAVSPAGDVLLTTSPGKLTLVSGVASWPGVLLTDSTGLSNRVPYRLIVKGVGYYEDRIVELLKASVSGGIIRLSTIATAVPGPALASYVLQASVGQIGGPGGPLGLDGKMPAGQIPSSGGGIPASIFDAKGDLLTATAPDLPARLAAGADGRVLMADAAQSTGLRWVALTVSDIAALQAALDARQPLDADLTAIAAQTPGNGALIQRIAGAWASQTTAQVLASLGITYTDIAGTVPTAALPPLAINDVFVVADQAAMLALTAQRGDMAIRSDNGRTYALSTDSPTTLADWKEVLAAGQVQSVAGRTGVVVLVKGDVGLSLVDNTPDSGKPVSTAQQAALDGKVGLGTVDAKGDLLAGTANDTIARLAAGANGRVLMADSAQATGLVWSALGIADIASLQAALDLKAPLASPTFTGTTTTPRLITPPVGLADAATIATDAALGNHFRVTLAGNRTLGNPTNPTDGQKILWELIQDASGSRTITLDTKFAYGTDITSVVLTTTASKRDFLGAVYNLAADRWFAIAFAKGY